MLFSPIFDCYSQENHFLRFFSSFFFFFLSSLLSLTKRVKAPNVSIPKGKRIPFWTINFCVHNLFHSESEKKKEQYRFHSWASQRLRSSPKRGTQCRWSSDSMWSPPWPGSWTLRHALPLSLHRSLPCSAPPKP